MKTSMFTTVALTLLLFANTHSHAAPVQVVGAGKLIGINNVNVLGYGLYNVTLNDNFSGKLYSEGFASAATDSLFNLYTGTGLFQGSTSDFNNVANLGCRLSNNCLLHTAFDQLTDINYHFKAFANWNEENDHHDKAYTNTLWAGVYANVSFLEWAPVGVSEVPIPAAAFMFAPALLGFMGLRRRAKVTVA